MEKSVTYRDRQELQSSDLNNMESYVQDSIDHIVLDALEGGKAYAGLSVTKTAATQVTVAPGRLYSAGAVYLSDQNIVIDMFNLLPVVTKKRVAIVVYGQGVDSDVQPRDFLLDAQTGQTEPQSVSMTHLRQGTISTVAGIESPDPTYPTTDATVTVVAYVTLDTSGVASVEQWTDTQLENLRLVANRTEILESWRNLIGAQVDTLKTDLSNIGALLKGFASLGDIESLARQLANLLDRVNHLPAPTVIECDTHHCNDDSESDTTASLYNCVCEEGFRFPGAASASVALSLLNPTDPSVVVNSGFVLPVYTNKARIVVEKAAHELRLSSFTFRSGVTFTHKTRSRFRARTGDRYKKSSASDFIRNGDFDDVLQTFKLPGEAGWSTVTSAAQAALSDHRDPQAVVGFREAARPHGAWLDRYTEPHWDRVVTTSSGSGSHVAMVFTNAQDGWLTQLGLHFSRLAASGDVSVFLTELTGGNPDTNLVLARVDVPFANLQVGAPSGGAGLPVAVETKIQIPPTFLAKGRRYAVIVVTAADHYIFCSDDEMSGAQGDVVQWVTNAWGPPTGLQFKMNLYYAAFATSNLVLQLTPLQLSGGISAIDILAEGIIPAATQLNFAAQVGGIYTPFGINGVGPDFSSLPALVPLNANFIGTSDLMPGFNLTKSNAMVIRAGTACKWISNTYTVVSTTLFHITVRMEGFNVSYHTCAAKLRYSASDHAADSYADTTNADGTVDRRFVWSTSALTSYAIVVDSTTSLAGNEFIVSRIVRNMVS